MDRDADHRPEIVSIADHHSGREEAVRPGVIVWLEEPTPDLDEASRAAAMRRHPANTSPRHLRAVS